MGGERRLRSRHAMPCARRLVEVTDSDLDDVILPAGESVEVWKGNAARAASRACGPTSNSVPAGGAPEHASIPSAQPDAGGAFQFHRVFPDAYQVAVTGLADTQVKSVEFAGRDITNATLDLASSAGGTLEITLSTDGGEIAGTAHGADREPLPERSYRSGPPEAKAPGRSRPMKTAHSISAACRPPIIATSPGRPWTTIWPNTPPSAPASSTSRAGDGGGTRQRNGGCDGGAARVEFRRSRQTPMKDRPCRPLRLRPVGGHLSAAARHRRPALRFPRHPERR